MYKKGHRPHNKGDTRVKMNYRNKPKKDKGMEYGEGEEYLEDLGNSFIRRWGLGQY